VGCDLGEVRIGCSHGVQQGLLHALPVGIHVR
jgi:hypothetical protein